MPIHRSKDSKGAYYQWGNQKKYYYIAGNKASRERAYKKCVKQAQAIHANGGGIDTKSFYIHPGGPYIIDPHAFSGHPGDQGLFR